MADFQKHVEEFRAEDMGVLAGSVDTLPEAKKTVNDLGLSFPMAYGLDPESTIRDLGGFFHQEKGFLQPSGFVLRPNGAVEVASYSSGPIGRLQAADVLAMVRYYKQNRD